MKWQEIAVATSPEAAEAVAESFYQTGAAGVVIQDPGDIARYLSEAKWDAYDLSPELLEAENVVVKAYLPVDADLAERLDCFRAKLNELANHFPGHPLDVTLCEVCEEDWATAWKAHFHPQLIGNRVVVCPTWEEYQAGQDEVVIRLDPGMAFGTGNHPTTAACIKLLEKNLEPGSMVYDVGTGSGVLAIAAALLGAERVVAVDVDPLAVKIAGDNVAKNHLQDRVEVRQADLMAGLTEQADLVVANIVADVIMTLAPQAYGLLRAGGMFITAGIIRHRLLEVQRVLLDEGFVLVDVLLSGEWAAMVAMAEK